MGSRWILAECIRALLHESSVDGEGDRRSEEARTKDERHAMAGALVAADLAMSVKRLSAVVEAVARGLGGG